MAKVAKPDVSTNETTGRELSECSAAVTCAICVDPFVDGRSLSCSHTFCLLCLSNYQKSHSSIQYCPTCRKQTVPPKGDLYTLPVNTFANAVACLVRKHQPCEAGQMQMTKPIQQGQQQFNPMLQSQQPQMSSQWQPVWQGSLEFTERRANLISQSDRPLIMQAKLMADGNTDADLIANGGLFKWPQKISVYPIPEVILTQSSECKHQLSTDTRRLNVIADTNTGSPFRTFVNMLIEKGMAGVVNMNSQNEYQIMVLFAVKSQQNTTCAMRALLPRQQSLFYEEFKRSVQLYKDKTKSKTAAAGIRGPGPMSGMPGQMANRLANPVNQRQMNPNMQQMIINPNQGQQQMQGMMGGQVNQGGLQQPNNMQPQGQQMGNLNNPPLVNQQMGGQRPHQNTSMMRSQMMQMQRQPMQGQQMQGQQMQGQQMQGQQMQGQPMQGQQMQGQQMQGQQMQGQQMQGQPMQGQQMQGQPMQGQQIQGQPMQGQQIQGQPMQGQPMQGQQMQGQPMQGQQMQGQPMQSLQMQSQQMPGQQMQVQQMQGQQMLLQQPNKQQQLLMSGNTQPGQPGQPMGASTLDELQSIFNS